jgi:7-carboxy-7-deazaguanine synthase
VKYSSRTEDQVTFCVDYKLPKSGMEKRMVANAFGSLRSVDSIKYVIADAEDFGAAMAHLASMRIQKVEATALFSPVWNEGWGIQGLAQALIANYQFSHLHPYRLSLQIHKIIWDPGTRKT